MQVEIRPSIAADLAFVAATPPYRTRCITVLVDGAPAALCGMIFRPDGVWLSAHITARARAARVSLHRAGLTVMAWARQSGISRLYATADPAVPRAAAWLARLGLRETPWRDDEGKAVWMWEAHAQPDR